MCLNQADNMFKPSLALKKSQKASAEKARIPVPRASSWVTTSLAPYRGHSGLSGPKSPKSRKKVPGASRPRGQIRSKQS